MPAASIIKVEQDGKEVFRGVLTQYTVDNYGNYVCVAMDLLACLDNVLKAPFAASGVTVNSYVSTLLNDYNDAAGGKYIELGNITVSGSITVNHDEEFVSIFALFKELIAEKGGLPIIRTSRGTLQQRLCSLWRHCSICCKCSEADGQRSIHQPFRVCGGCRFQTRGRL